MSTSHSSSSPPPSIRTGIQRGHSASTPAEEEDDEYERLMHSSSPPPEPDALPSDSTDFNNQGQRWDDIIDPALSAVDSSTASTTAQPRGVRNESVSARRLAERERLLPYQRTALDEFTQV